MCVCVCVCTCTVGRSWKDKVEDIRTKMGLQSATTLVVTSMDEIAC